MLEYASLTSEPHQRGEGFFKGEGIGLKFDINIFSGFTSKEFADRPLP